MTQLGIEGMRVDRSTGELLRDFYGVEPGRLNLAEVARIASTEPERLGALLPQNTPVAHKTGTVGGVANDVGYITLPDQRDFAIVVFTRGSETPMADRERAIAEVARTLYEFFCSSLPPVRRPIRRRPRSGRHMKR